METSISASRKTRTVRTIAFVVLGFVILGIIGFFIWVLNSDNSSAAIFRDLIEVTAFLFGPFLILFVLLFIGASALGILTRTWQRSFPPIRLKSKLLKEEITPKLVENNPQAAIEHAFTLFEDNLRKKINAGPDIYGETLINRAFGKDGMLTYGPVTNEDKGIRDLMAGAYATLRNPRKHRVVRDNEDEVTSIIALIDMLILLTDDSHNK